MDLVTIISKVKNNDVLIPDFQRGFVWKDIEMQKRLIASVLAKLPIGSILLLDGDPSEFQAKKLGRKTRIEDVGEGQKRYLLDGQQRMTVLTNAFSNVILEQGQMGDLISYSLKNRYFLQVKANKSFDDIDLFGLTNLFFPFSPNDDPIFLADQAFEKIVVESSVNHPVLPYSVQYATHNIQQQILAYCINDLDSLKIPLMLLSTPIGLNLVTLILNSIAKMREEEISETIISYYNQDEDSQFEHFIDSIKDLIFEEQLQEFYSDEESALNALSILKINWINNMRDYLSRLIRDLNLNEIIVPSSQRARAIDIYENLNKGGVVLSTFDLVVAKAAQIDNTNFAEKILVELSCTLDNNAMFPSGFRVSEWNPIDDLGAYNTKNSEFSSIFINVFLNLLSINTRTNRDNFDVGLSDVKREAVLSLTSQQIVDNYAQTVRGIKRALCFMNVRLGIRKINDINYEHVLLNLSRVLMFDDWWNEPITFKKLEYWYWIVLFSGSYDKDQSSQMIQDMKTLDKFMNQTIDYDHQYFINMKSRIFSNHYFTNEEILLMELVEYNNTPKKVIRDIIVQFILSKMPSDFMKDADGNPCYLKAYDKIEKDVHHIIPLASAGTVGQGAQSLRKNDEHYLNSPLNFTIISSSANKSISAEPMTSYLMRLPTLPLVNHFLPPVDFIQTNNTEQAHKTWLKQRYNMIKGGIFTQLNSLAENI